MKLTVTKAFAWAHRGVEIEKFEPGSVFETDDADLITVASAEGWVVSAEDKATTPKSSKAHKAAPENKAP